MKNLCTLLVLATLFVIVSAYAPVKSKSPAAISKEIYFPVTGNKSKIGSHWGDERDGGRRRHEGIDIFADRGTPLIAISDGFIVFAGHDELGGKTITLQPDDYAWEAYYAHLDKHYVSSGQYVKKGQLIGTVGNTGNAKTTPAHLHFGIYTKSGAIDPLPYVQSSPKMVRPVAVDVNETRPNGTNKKANAPQRGRRPRGTVLGAEVKTAATRIITGELLRRVRIKL